MNYEQSWDFKHFGPHSTIIHFFIKKNSHCLGLNHFTVGVLVSQKPRLDYEQKIEGIKI